MFLSWSYYKFDAASSLGFVVGSLGSAATSSASWSASTASLNLVIHISFYPWQHYQGSALHASRPVVRQHHMILHPRLSKTMNPLFSNDGFIFVWLPSLLGNRSSWLSTHYFLWCWQVWGSARCNEGWNSGVAYKQHLVFDSFSTFNESCW